MQKQQRWTVAFVNVVDLTVVNFDVVALERKQLRVEPVPAARPY
jgi:hypothetical protein